MFTGVTQAAVITVNTTDNVNPGAGKTSLLMAMQSLHDGDEIQFNIPGTGPFYIQTPVNGYPVITNNNVTLDGYSQPGAQPNTNNILAANNAKLMIVLDSRNSNFTSMNLWPNNGNAGYGSDEYAILGVVRATNVTIRGLSLLGVPPGFDNNNASGNHDYGIAFGCDDQGTPTGGHVSGCWIGVAPDGKTLAGTTYAITGFRWRDPSGNNPVLTDDLTIGVAKNSTNAPAEFNVIVQTAIPIIIEGNNTRIAGNFLGVMPDGVTEYNVALVQDSGGNYVWTGDFQYEGAIEIGRGGNNTVIGTDGDGVNDANERNVIVGTMPSSMNGYDHTIEFYGNNPGTNIVIAGNYIGVGVNGSTYFTNGVPAINASGGSSQYRIGSNEDGTSDDVEGNVIVNNWPPDVFPSYQFPDETKLNFFDEISVGSMIALRGNQLIDNFPYPVSPAKQNGADNFRTDYYASVLVDSTQGVTPVLDTNSTTITRLVGTVPLAYTNNWPTTIIDLYAADNVGITNGQAAMFPDLPYGFVQGAQYVASFVDNGPKDRDNRPGHFDFDLTGIDTKGSLITVTANYVNTNAAIVMTSPFADPASVTFIPGSLESVGLTRIVPDTVVTNPVMDSLGNWEPYASVLGNSTFLISCGGYAPDQNPPNPTAAGYLSSSAPFQNFLLYLQPATGGTGRSTMEFYTDAGAAFGAPINFSRQNGNPPRVAGDKRPGAVNYLTAAETSAGQIQLFNNDTRWSSNLIYQADNRYVTVQPFSLNTSTLVATPLRSAFDAVYGDLADLTDTPGGGNQVSRTGGTVVGLDNGNFAVVIDDKTGFQNAGSEVTTASIISPTGAIVKDRWLVDPHDIWDNVAAYQGGFCVRVHNLLYFYDDAGTLKGSVDQATSGESYDAGRGDGTRIGAHINSPYVYLIGKVTTANVVRVSVFDSRNQTFVAKADVSEGAFTGGFDRANIAVDALNRFAATWVSQPAGYTQQQVAARLMAFDPAAKTISALTPSFFPFVNFATNNIRTVAMTVAMTTKQVMVAAKGEINLENNPSAGPDSPHEINFFTVFSHPNPQDDPTPPVGGGNIQFGLPTVSGNNLVLTWTGGTGPYTVQMKTALSDSTWRTVTTTSSQTATVPLSGASGFFRIQQ
jgi:hypothetical protein